MIHLTDVTFAYPGHSPVIENLNWHVGQGEAWAVLGPSGGGKSTLLYLLAGLLQPTSGTLTIDGERQVGPRPRTGLILQDYGLLPWATAYDNVTLGLRIRRFYGPDGKHAPADESIDGRERVKGRALYWLERLGLRPHLEKYPGQLSGGQRQRVAIARTLAMNPDLLLMDEPFSSLDAPTREGLQELTFALRAEQELTTVIVTHAVEEAAILGKKILVLGEPPNRQPASIDNDQAGTADFRYQPAYFETVQRLRHTLEVRA